VRRARSSRHAMPPPCSHRVPRHATGTRAVAHRALRSSQPLATRRSCRSANTARSKRAIACASSRRCSSAAATAASAAVRRPHRCAPRPAAPPPPPPLLVAPWLGAIDAAIAAGVGAGIAANSLASPPPARHAPSIESHGVKRGTRAQLLPSSRRMRRSFVPATLVSTSAWMLHATETRSDRGGATVSASAPDESIG